MAPRQKRRVTLSDLVRRRWPAWDDPTIAAAIAGGEILVEGRILTNPGAWVGADSAVRHRPAPELAGRRKLAWAITRFGVAAGGRTALDVGASTGGFTTAWLDAGAVRVYAVDAGHGQLLGSLRQDPRVVNLERTNVSDLTPAVIPVPVEVVSVDVSYLSLTAAVAQLGAVPVAGGAELLGLVKPMFELRLATIPEDPPTLRRACAVAVAGLTDQGWEVAGADECPVRGGKGAVEFFVHARAPG
jgi:23S rRNA (cytidine1920-2'-O)/16S rRNA (cytidine1409-2'-O)-methyltransferase